MIPTEEISKICSEYGIGNYISRNKINQGVLNDNYLLETTAGKYFIKSVREKAKDRLQMIYGVEFLMKLSGIPAIVMLKIKSGDIFLVDGDRVYTVYPFVEAEKSNNYSGTDYQRMGEMLGKIHIAGSKNISEIQNLKQFKRPEDNTILERLKNYKDQIHNKDSQDEVDTQFLEYIDFKLETYPKIKPNELPNDTLIHGDYHPGNLLIDKNTREIIGVCDWEKAEFGPRAYELARSLLYSCFYDGYELSRALTDSKLFLTGYLLVYPIDKQEILDGLNMRIHRMALSSWIEEKYYKKGDSRANKFIKHEMDLVNFLTNGDLLYKIDKLINEKWN